MITGICEFSAISSSFKLHYSQLRVTGSKGEIIGSIGIGETENGAGHVTDYAKNMARVVVKETDLVSTCTACHNNVLFVIELSSVNEWCW